MDVKNLNIELREIKERYPWELLLLADPCKDTIEKYLYKSNCYAIIQEEERVGVVVVQPKGEGIFELMNIAIRPDCQNKGYGTSLLKVLIAHLKEEHAIKIEVGTGTFGYQLKFYQKVGFRVEEIIKNFFLDNYPAPIFEDKLRHKDMLRLGLMLNRDDEFTNQKSS